MTRGVRPQETVPIKVRTLDGEQSGPFTFVRRRMGDLGLISAELSRLAGGVPIVTDEMKAILSMMAELRIVTVQAPDWFNLDEMEDTSVLPQVWDQYVRWRDRFRERETAAAGAGNGKSVGESAGGATPDARGAGAGEPGARLSP